VWDLHYPDPLAVRHEYPISAIYGDTPRSPQGPMALPGEYTVKLIAGGKTLTQPLSIRMDPRVKTPAAGLKTQFDLSMKVAGMMRRTFDGPMTAGRERLNGQLSTLLNVLQGTDATPTTQAIAAVSDIEATFEKTNQ
jgi:hypothetical protein